MVTWSVPVVCVGASGGVAVTGVSSGSDGMAAGTAVDGIKPGETTG
jgi:hypothetical protein